MKFTKTLASIAAAAIAVSSLAVSAFAADINLGKELNADELALLKDTDTTFVVEYDSPNGWDDIGFGASIDEIGTWASANFKVEVGKGTLTVTVADILKKMGIESLADASYMKVEGYNETTISKVEIKAADAEKPAEPKPIQTKADISFTDGKTPSYTYTVKGDIDALKVDVALSADAAAAGSGWNDYCSAGVAVKNPDGTVKYYQWGGARVNWSWDVDGDNVGETKDGVGTETWVGTVGADGGQISIPVVKGAVVDFYCLSWDAYNGVQYTLTINDEEAAVNPGETEDPTKPGETEDPTKPGETEDPTKPGETEDPTKPGETEDPAEPGESSGDVNPGECSGEPVNPPTGAAVAVIPAVLAAAAVATTGIVLKKRSK